VLCQFVEKAGRILRDEQLMASQVFVVLRTSRFKDAAQSYSSHQGMSLPHYTDDTRLFIRCATALLEALYKPRYEYKKIGVLLTGLEKVENVHPTFDQPDVKPSRLMKVLDSLQKKGHNIGFANYGNQPLWHKEHLSRGYTTNWADIPETSRD
jgi:DNA polymerase V